MKITWKLIYFYLNLNLTLVICGAQYTSDVHQLTNVLIHNYSNHSERLTIEQFNNLLNKVRSPLQTKKFTTKKCDFSEKICNVSNYCLSAQELLNFSTDYHEHNDEINDKKLIEICPIILSQIESGICRGKSDLSVKDPQGNKPLEVWGYGILFVTLISLCSLVGVSVLPVMGKKLYQRLLTFLIGLAVGSLCGSAVFHLIPQAFDLIPEGDEDHNYLFVSLGIMGGIYLFFMTECLMKILMEARKRQINKWNRNYSDVDTLKYLPSTISEEFQRSVGDLSSNLTLHKQISESQSAANQTEIEKSPNGTSHKHEHHIEFKPGKDSAIATVAWMIIFGDGLHNFIDGLSIGAAFNKSILTGVSISVAVLCEEFPHELGDFAVLLNAGMSMKQALLYNFLSALTCYLGLVVGILLGELTAASTYIFALAGGMFLYISLVDMVPEMNETLTRASRESVSKALGILFLQNLGWISGVTALFTLAYYNKSIKFD